MHDSVRTLHPDNYKDLSDEDKQRAKDAKAEIVKRSNQILDDKMKIEACMPYSTRKELGLE